MTRGRCRLFLGAAAGAGTTFAMLQEGQRAQAEGRDVVVGLVETHGRTGIAALRDGFEVVPLLLLETKGTVDLDGILSRRPDVVLIDELAARNPPGARNEKRWHDVEELLEAGIDVASTLKVQNLESLNDVVFEITGVREPETIADEIVSQMADIELIDIAPDRIRRRLREGKIYPAESIDTALANYFRPGSLSALRELALSWTADRVDEIISTYRSIHGIDEPWETKERILVGLPGVPGADVLVRRAARTALRSRAKLLGVHVRPTGRAAPDLLHLSEQRALLESLGGEYHEMAGDDVAESLLAFAGAENVTQIVLGASRGPRLREWIGGSPAAKVIRGSKTIDVHIISYESAGRQHRPRRQRSRVLGLHRRLPAWFVAGVGLPLLTLFLLSVHQEIALENVLLIYLLTAVGVGVIGGAFPAVAAAGGGFLLANWYFAPPVRTWKIDDASHLFSLFAFLLVASLVGLLVGNSTRRSAEARKARAQAEALAAIHPLFSTDAQGVTRRIHDVFAMTAASVLRRLGDGWEPLAAVGAFELLEPDDATEVIPLTDDTVLALSGGALSGDDRRILRAFAAQMAQALEREKLEKEAAGLEAMAETDRLRTALLNAVSHDLRTPLATIKASVTSLLETGVRWSVDDTKAFLGAILSETERLNRLVGRLLDASRVQVGAVNVFKFSVGLDEVVSAALSGLGVQGDLVEIDLPETLPPVLTDPGLAERVVANLVENALTWSPVDQPVIVSAGEIAGRVDLRIIDRGPGIPAEDRTRIFQPFQRLGDSSRGAGVGLGMAVARGFLEAMGNELLVEDTPGGGTTMIIGFTPAPPVVVTAGATRGTVRD